MEMFTLLSGHLWERLPLHLEVERVVIAAWDARLGLSPSDKRKS